MSPVLPDPPPLEMPDEDPAALADAVTAVSGAASQLGILGVHLTGPAAAAPDWLGDDAAAAAAQVAAVTAVARAAHEALGSASDRLSRHAEVLADVRRSITALRRQQQDDHAAAAARLADVLVHPVVPTSPGHPPVVVALGDELRAADAARQRRHAALLAQLHSDAAGTARVLADAASVVGGTGRPDDSARVLAALAVRLPGWGDGELSARGAALARFLMGPMTRDEMESRARAAAPYAGTTAFADALLAGLGSDGLRWLLSALPAERLDGGSDTAGLLALALGGARRSGAVVDPVGEVLDATYVRERAPGADDDMVALGLAAVLSAAVPTGPGAIPAATVARWGGQVFRREEWWRSTSSGAARALDRAGPMNAGQADPVEQVIRFLAAAGDPSAAVAVLPDRASWEIVLQRSELAVSADDVLRRMVELIAAVPGAAGDTAVRAGLEALGAGIADEDANHWLVVRSMADTVSFPLAAALAEHPDVLSGVLLAAAGSEAPSAADRLALRALGYVSVDPGSASVLGAAVAGWARAHAGDIGELSLPVGALAVGSLVAVRENGQRLLYALHGFDARDAAESAHRVWNWTAYPVLNFAMPAWTCGIGAAVEPFLAHAWKADGTWDNGRDTGLVFDRPDAEAVAEVELGSDSGQPDDALRAAASTGFVRAGRVLGAPLPPESPEWDFWGALMGVGPGSDMVKPAWGGVERMLGRLPR